MFMKRIAFYFICAATFWGCSSPVKDNNGQIEYNETIKTILERRSVRSYTPEAIPPDTLDLIVKAAMAAPTGLDKRPWEFIVLDNKDDVYKYFQATGNERFETAPAAIIVCGNTDISDLWYIDCSCAAQNLLLAAHSMGLGAVFTAGFPIKGRMDAITEHFKLPENIVPLCAIPIGHPELDGKPKNKYDKSKIHINAW